MTKKSNLLQALLCAGVLCFTTACGSTPDSEPDNRESMIKEVSNLPDAKITIPATLAGDELADIPVDNADGSQLNNKTENQSSSDDTEQSDESIHGTIDADNNITYQLDGDTRAKLINDMASEIQTSIDTVLSDKEYYPNISDITVNSDCTEFTIYLTTDEPNLYESTLMMSFYTVGDRYQIYNGVSAEDAKTTVIYINADSGAELARTDSASAR